MHIVERLKYFLYVQLSKSAGYFRPLSTTRASPHTHKQCTSNPHLPYGRTHTHTLAGACLTRTAILPLPVCAIGSATARGRTTERQAPATRLRHQTAGVLTRPFESYPPDKSVHASPQQL